VAVDGSGNVYIADEGNAAIKEWSASNQQVTTIVSGLYQAAGVAVDGSGNVYLSDVVNNVIQERVRAFVPTGAVSEKAAAGTGHLLPVLPTAQPLTGVFAPTSDQSWLKITGVANGVVSFSFTQNTTGKARTAHIFILGDEVTITQGIT
jgi:hypothetical protein